MSSPSREISVVSNAYLSGALLGFELQERPEIMEMVEDLYDDLYFNANDPVIRLFWFADVGRFYDECGFPIKLEEEHEYFSQAEMNLFFKRQCSMRFPRPGGVDVELIFPENIYD